MKAAQRRTVVQESVMRLRLFTVVLAAVVSQASPALAQSSPGMAPSYTGGSTADYERQQREYWRAQEAARMEQQRRQDMNDEQRRRDEEASKRNHRIDGGAPSPGSPPSYGGGSQTADMRALGKEMLREPPLPVERNVLLGSWRLEGAGQQNRVLEFGLTGKGATPGMGELMGYMKSIESGQLACDMSFGRGMTFTPTTFSSGGAAGIAGGPVAYRSRKKQVIVAIPGDSRANPMLFEVVGPHRIVSMIGGCALVRVGAPATRDAANATTTPGSVRLAAASPSVPPPSTLSRPSPEVCRNTLLDKLGNVDTSQVRAMAGQRFREAAIEGKVPNSNHLRLDLRGSACDDPRVKAMLYDFDANDMLQSVTYVWDRPAGPTPAPIFSERIAQLARFHSLPPPQSPGRLQADTSLGRLILQDLPERNLLLEAYTASR
jgi:hypothetical protein